MRIHIPDEEIVGFQMAPLIDCVFLLVIFFMVASNLSQSERIPVTLPVATHSTRPRDPSGRGVITVKKDGQIFTGVRLVTLDQVRDTVATRLKEDPQFRIFLRADKGTPHKHVRAVMRACADGGVADIIFAAYNQEPGT